MAKLAFALAALLVVAAHGALPGTASEPKPTKPLAQADSSAPQPPSVPAGCADSPADWVSSTKTGCQQYKDKKWCTLDGKPGPGWKKEYGTFAEWAVGGKDATQACCVCGGGSGGGLAQADGAPRPPPSELPKAPIADGSRRAPATPPKQVVEVEAKAPMVMDGTRRPPATPPKPVGEVEENQVPQGLDVESDASGALGRSDGGDAKVLSASGASAGGASGAAVDTLLGLSGASASSSGSGAGPIVPDTMGATAGAAGSEGSEEEVRVDSMLGSEGGFSGAGLPGPSGLGPQQQGTSTPSSSESEGTQRATSDAKLTGPAVLNLGGACKQLASLNGGLVAIAAVQRDCNGKGPGCPKEACAHKLGALQAKLASAQVMRLYARVLISCVLVCRDCARAHLCLGWRSKVSSTP